MPYLQRATNNPFGFMPANGTPGEISVNPYLVSSTEVAIYAGDIVVMGSSGQVMGAGTGVWSSGIVGVAAMSLAAGAGSTAATPLVNSSQMLLVYDDPLQVFTGIDTTSGYYTNVHIGKQVGVNTTGRLGSTGPNTTLSRSVMTLAVTPSTGAQGPFRLIGLHPVDANTSSGIARKWLLQVNNFRGPYVTVTT